MAYLRPDLARLATDWNVIYFDQRGAGRSTVTRKASSLTVSKHVDDLDTVRRFLDLDRVVLLGHSWGAGLALQYAVRFPDRVSALLLANPIPPRQTPYMEQFSLNLTAWMEEPTRKELARLEAARIDANDPVAACRDFWSLFIRGYFADPSRVSSIRGDVCDDPAEAVRNHSRVASLTVDSLGDWDWQESLATVHARTLVIHGDADPIPLESAREWAAAMPNARLFVIEDSGHFPFVEQPQIFFAAADEFLRGAWPGDARVVEE
jgi:proline iminopeptidase